MEQVIYLGDQTFWSINGPLLCLVITANICYAFCLIFNTQRLRQPLKTLLGYQVWCSISYCVTLVFMYGAFWDMAEYNVYLVSWGIVQYFVHCSMTCSVWLNLYYFIQIVPAQRALLIWLKRNIKPVMRMVLLFDWTFFLLQSVFSTAATIFSGYIYVNGTLTEYWNEGLYRTDRVFCFTSIFHMLLCMCVMMVSSFSTAHFLQKHIRSVAQGGSFFSTPRIQSQIRVTISGITQGVLYFLYATFYLFDAIAFSFFMDFILTVSISFTVTSMYLLGTTVNLGIGQAIFRKKAVNVFKAFKALCGVTNGVKMQLASGEITTIKLEVNVTGHE